MSRPFSRSVRLFTVTYTALRTAINGLVNATAKPSKDKLKAAELLGKRYGLYTEKVEEKVDMELNVTIDYGDEEDTGGDAD